MSPKSKVVIVGDFFKRKERFEIETEGRRQVKTRTGMKEETTSYRHLEVWLHGHLDFRLWASKTVTESLQSSAVSYQARGHLSCPLS